VLFVAQATSSILHRENHVNLLSSAGLAVKVANDLTISPFSQSACNVSASEPSDVRWNGTLPLMLWVGCSRARPRLTQMRRTSSKRVNLMALVMRFYAVS
jgi:hypothetical protein